MAIRCFRVHPTGPVIMIPDGDPLFGRVSLDDLRTNRKNGEEKAENRVAGN